MRRGRHTAHQAVAGLALMGLIGIPGLPGDEPPASTTTTTASAQLRGLDGKLRRGCRDYAYTYSVTSPTTDWQLESDIRGPGGVPVASDVILSGADATSGTKTFRLCRRTNKPGLYRITGIFTYRDYPETHSVAAAGDTFVLEKVRRKRRR